MSTTIKCPNCGNEFEPNDAIRDEVQKELRQKMVDWQSQKQKEFEAEKTKIQKETEETLRKHIASDFENKLRLLEQNNKDNEEKLKQAREKELEFLQKEQDLKNKEAEIEITVHKQLQKDREKLTEDIRKIEVLKIANKETEYQMKIKELEKKNDDTIKLLDEAKKKNEQVSMQLQGEVQELALEDMLRASFPFDIISEVGKGIRGADCIQTVRNNFGQECGQIIYESKRTSTFSIEWIEKLKADMRSQGAEIAVIVTKTMPKDMDCMGIKDGVYVCNFSEVKSLAAVLRDGVIKVFNAAKNQENKGDKMHLLYDYLTSTEFAEQWKAIREGFMSMKLSIQKERDTMERLWKAREKQLEKVLLNAAHVRGSIEGIAGMNSVDLNLLEEGDEDTVS